MQHENIHAVLVRLPEHTHDKLKQQAVAESRSVGSQARVLIQTALKESTRP